MKIYQNKVFHFLLNSNPKALSELLFLKYISGIKTFTSFDNLNAKSKFLFDIFSGLNSLIASHFKLSKENNSRFYTSNHFELNRNNSSYLFYIQYVENANSILHLKNFKTNSTSKIDLYPRNSDDFYYSVDCEQHKGFIFSCGGYQGGVLRLPSHYPYLI